VVNDGVRPVQSATKLFSSEHDMMPTNVARIIELSLFIVLLVNYGTKLSTAVCLLTMYCFKTDNSDVKAEALLNCRNSLRVAMIDSGFPNVTRIHAQ